VIGVDATAKAVLITILGILLPGQASVAKTAAAAAATCSNAFESPALLLDRDQIETLIRKKEYLLARATLKDLRERTTVDEEDSQRAARLGLSHYYEGLVAYRLTDPKGAESYFQKAKALCPSWPSPNYMLAMVLWQKGLSAKARLLWQQVVDSNGPIGLRKAANRALRLSRTQQSKVPTESDAPGPAPDPPPQTVNLVKTAPKPPGSSASPAGQHRLEFAVEIGGGYDSQPAASAAGLELAEAAGSLHSQVSGWYGWRASRFTSLRVAAWLEESPLAQSDQSWTRSATGLAVSLAYDVPRWHFLFRTDTEFEFYGHSLARSRHQLFMRGGFEIDSNWKLMAAASGSWHPAHRDAFVFSAGATAGGYWAIQWLRPSLGLTLYYNASRSFLPQTEANLDHSGGGEGGQGRRASQKEGGGTYLVNDSRFSHGPSVELKWKLPALIHLQLSSSLLHEIFSVADYKRNARGDEFIDFRRQLVLSTGIELSRAFSHGFSVIARSGVHTSFPLADSELLDARQYTRWTASLSLRWAIGTNL
jgi:hypothetical protein